MPETTTDTALRRLDPGRFEAMFIPTHVVVDTSDGMIFFRTGAHTPFTADTAAQYAARRNSEVTRPTFRVFALVDPRVLGRLEHQAGGPAHADWHAGPGTHTEEPEPDTPGESAS